MNKVILRGRLARDPEIKTTSTGKQVATFTIAVNRRKAKDAEQTADFIPCVAWEKLAEVIGNHCTKGSDILVEGSMQVRSYEAQDGTKRYVTEVIVSQMEFCGSKQNSSDSAPGAISGKTVSDDIEIPF